MQHCLKGNNLETTKYPIMGTVKKKFGRKIQRDTVLPLKIAE